MFLNNAFLTGRSGASRLMYTSAILMILFTLSISTAAAQGGGGVLRVGLNEPINLDPATGSNDPEVLFNRNIYDYLIEIRPDSTLAPNLATEWTVSDDGLTYTFTLVEGATFHDGSPFTSADVVFTFNRLQSIGSPALGLLGEFEVSAPDESTVVFTLPSVNADFLYGVGSRFASILKDGTETPNVIGDDGGLGGFNGTGPFVLSAYNPGVGATFTRNENYWQEGAPLLDGLEFVFIEDSLAQVDALRSGAVDFIFKLNVDQVATLESEGTVTILQVPTNQHPVIRIRSDAGALGEDVRVRQAFKLATNRQELLDVVQQGYGVLGNNDPIGPLYSDFFASDLEQPQYDPEAACALILEATGEERLSTDFYVVDSFNYEALATSLQQQWAEGCIDVNILLRPENVYYADTEWLEVDLGITGWGDRPVPQGYLTEAYITDGIYNESHFSDAELDELVAQAAVTTDTAARAEIYNQISQIFAERGPIIIPWFASVIGAANSSVQGLEMHPFPGQTDFRTVSIGG
ncbi:MAG: ABC transporter substrate-binding protein [bacterium]|nr:ABC transporter substrate-binding protein [bacterium]